MTEEGTRHMLEAIDRAAVAVFALFGTRGQVIAVPVTPYSHHGKILVTATLAYTRKAELVRQNPTVAMLAGGVHCTGRAEVFSDASGDFFVKHVLEDEIRKYPPALALTKVPFHRKVFSWYFGRAIISFEAERIEPQPKDDSVTLITSVEGRPRITPLPLDYAALVSDLEFTTDAQDGPALLLAHRESDDMSDLRQMSIRGEVGHGVFREASRTESLDIADGGSEWTRRRNATKARKIMKDWPKMPA